jgi:hypothetical protein
MIKQVARKFLPYMKKLGTQVGIVLEKTTTMVDKLKKVDGVLFVKVLTSSNNTVAKADATPLLRGGFHDQRAEYSGLPN